MNIDFSGRYRDGLTVEILNPLELESHFPQGGDPEH